MTMAQHRDAGFHFDEPLFGCRKVDSPREKKGSEGLHMPAAQPGTRPEDRGHECWRLLCQDVSELRIRTCF
jgi:hypothetical protein